MVAYCDIYTIRPVMNMDMWYYYYWVNKLSWHNESLCTVSAWRCLENVCMWMRGRSECLSSLMKMNWVIHWIAGLIKSVWYLLQRGQVLSAIHTHSFMGHARRTNNFEPNQLACHLDYILRLVLPILDCLDAWIAKCINRKRI